MERRESGGSSETNTGGLEMSLVTSLYNSRKYDHSTNTVYYQSDVVDLVRQLEAKANAQGLTLSRWQTNKGGHQVNITWALHTGARPNFTRDLPEESKTVKLSQLEGTTKRCEAYRKLSKLL